VVAGSDVETVRSGIDTYNRGDLESLLGYFDPEVVVRDPERTGRAFRGHAGLRQFWAEWLENWEEHRIEPREFIEKGDEIFVACDQHGRGKLSGVEVKQDIFLVYRMRSGKVVEFRLYTDRAPALDSMNG
jgi:ketosteroid isomerase-like protein